MTTEQLARILCKNIDPDLQVNMVIGANGQSSMRPAWTIFERRANKMMDDLCGDIIDGELS